MKRFLTRLKRVTGNPWALAVVSLSVLLCSISETIETLADDLEQHHVRAHHGLLLLALYQCLKVLPDLFEGAEWLGEAGEDT